MTTIEGLLLAVSLLQHGGVPKAPPPPEPKPIVRPAPKPARTAHGWATYYDWRRGQAAAGPALRRLLGSGWRGDSVRVCLDGTTRCIRVTVTDFCACGPRKGMATVVDLDSRAFRRLAPLSRGIVEVTVSR